MLLAFWPGEVKLSSCSQAYFYSLLDFPNITSNSKNTSLLF